MSRCNDNGAYANASVSRFQSLNDHEIANGKETTVDLTKWFDFVALDIITDLGFGESLHSLETGQYHTWATFFLNSLRGLAFATAMKRFQLVFKLLLAFAPKSVMQKHQDMVDLTNRMVDKRLMEADRPDFIGAMSQSGKTSSEVRISHSNNRLPRSQGMREVEPVSMISMLTKYCYSQS